MTWRWPWTRRKTQEAECQESKLAYEREQRIRARVEANEHRVEQVAEDLASHRRTNHFSSLVEDAMHLRRKEAP